MKIIFFGTPDYAIPVVGALKGAGHEIVAVVTQPPKPVGRKKILTPSPIAKWAEKEKIRILDDRPKNVLEQLKEFCAPIAILASYGRIIPQSVIDVFPLGILNVHPSLLPKYRGATPVEAALVAGEKETGVTIIKLDAEMDHGPILAQVSERIQEDDDRINLRARLFQKGAELITEVLPEYIEGKLEPREQRHNDATYVTLFAKGHGFIPPEFLDAALKGIPLRTQWQIPFIKDFTIHPSPIIINNFIRAVNLWPGAFTSVKLKIKNENLERRLKILRAHLENTTTLVLDEVQLEGKNPVSWEQFQKGYPNASFS